MIHYKALVAFRFFVWISCQDTTSDRHHFTSGTLSSPAPRNYLPVVFFGMQLSIFIGVLAATTGSVCLLASYSCIEYRTCPSTILIFEWPLQRHGQLAHICTLHQQHPARWQPQHVSWEARREQHGRRNCEPCPEQALWTCIRRRKY